MTKNIHEAILEVMDKVGYVQKKRTGNLNYSYAGEAALIAALRPAMLESGIYSHVLEISYQREVYKTAKGSSMNNTLVNATVRFTHAASDTHIDVQAIGEGADIGDKSANKASTGMLKYALRQTFLIETGDDPDKHASTEMERGQTDASPARLWTTAQKGWLTEAGYTQNEISAKHTLDKSNLPGNAKKATILSWGKWYRAIRDEDKTSDEAADFANDKYKKRGK